MFHIQTYVTSHSSLGRFKCKMFSDIKFIEYIEYLEREIMKSIFWKDLSHLSCSIKIC